MKSGILAIDKPEGISSARVVALVKKKLGAKKVGHTGTLDPFATGLLLCAINQGTRISRFFLGGHKKYAATLCLGVETDTFDLTGNMVFEARKNWEDTIKKEDILNVMESFMGIQYQVPPVFSALKHEGQPLYKLARQGRKIQKQPRQIEIFDITLADVNLPYVEITVHCSSGTYIRSLAVDIGKKLGCGAHLVKLKRTQSSAFKLEQAIQLDEMETLDRDSLYKKIIPLTRCLAFMPKVGVDASIAQRIKFGQKLKKEDMPYFSEDPGVFVRVVDKNDDLLAIIQLNEDSQEYNYTCVFLS